MFLRIFSQIYADILADFADDKSLIYSNQRKSAINLR